MATQTIQFVKVGDEYVATFEATADFALHIERNEPGALSMGITSVPDSQYALVENFPERARHQTIFEHSFIGAIYPLAVQIKSATEPVLASVTFAE